VNAEREGGGKGNREWGGLRLRVPLEERVRHPRTVKGKSGVDACSELGEALKTRFGIKEASRDRQGLEMGKAKRNFEGWRAG